MSKGDGSWEEYRMHHVESIKWLTSEVNKQHDDLLTLKVKFGIMAIVFGGLSGIIGSVITYAVSHKLIP